jgi:sialic acid synthase SpsE
MVEAVRVAEKSLGHISYKITEKEKASRVFRRSLFVVEDMKTGDVFTRENVRSIRPGYGLPVRELQQILGKKAVIPIVRGTPLSNDLIR